MPNYRILFHRKADKALEGLDEKTKLRVIEDILLLEKFPEFETTPDIAKMEGQKDLYRLRTGKIRTVFTVDKATKTITILKIAQREAAYE